MPLGDSITKGSSSGVSDPTYMISYRKDLYDLLTADRYELDFVGTLNDGSAVFTDINLADHEGHGGWTDDQIVNGRSTDPAAGKLDQWLAVERPKIVLLHIGTNDLESNPDDVSNILDVIDSHESNVGEIVWVILARIINRSDYSSTTTAFNDNVEAMAIDRISNPANPAFPDKVIIVDMEDGAGIDYRLYPTGDMWDNLHPFATGYAKMADVWYTGLLAILPVADAGFDQSEYEGDIVTLNASGSYDPDELFISFFWEQQAGGSPVSLSDPTAETPFFTAPEVEPGGETLTFKLTVTDNDGFESVDTTNVSVLNDECPDDPNKTEPGVCGCGADDIDTDGDGIFDCNDTCPEDPKNKDSDNDGTLDCIDGCPADPNKTQPGPCGCGVADTDSDGDGNPDCVNDNNDNDEPSENATSGGGCFISTIMVNH